LADRTSGRFSPLGIYEPELVKYGMKAEADRKHLGRNAAL
ncbi:hypothetical protein T12_4601, partial [Trichinella patagoniensis]